MTAAALWLALAVLQPALPGARAGTGDDPVVITIDARPVPWSRYAQWLVRTEGDDRFERFVGPRLVEREAARRGVDVSREEVLARVHAEIDERVQGAFAGDRERWRAELASLETDEREFVERRAAKVRTILLVDRLLQQRRTVSDDEVRALYERRYGPGGRTLHVRALRLRLVVPTPEGGGSVEARRALREAALAELDARLRALRARALSGEDFAALADAQGEDPELGPGGAFEAAFDPANWPAAVVEAVGALEPGGITEPLYGRGFVNLFQLVRAERTPFDTVETELRNELLARPGDALEVTELARELRAAAEASRLPALASGGESGDAPVIAIDGELVRRDEYAAWIAREQPGRVLPREFVRRSLLREEARAQGIEVSDEALALAVEREVAGVIARLYRGDPERWLADLERHGSDEERTRRKLARRLELDLLADGLVLRTREVEPRAVRALWEARYGPGGRRVDVRLLRRTVELPPEAGALGDEARTRLAEERHAALAGELADLRRRAEDGEDFATLVERTSDDPETRARGGRPPGGFSLAASPEPLRAAIAALRPGEVSPPVRVGPFEYLVQLVGEEVVPFETVEAALTAELAAEPPTAAERVGMSSALLARHAWEYFPERLP